MTLDEFFSAYLPSRPLFETVRQALDAIGPTEMVISKSQIAFRRRKNVAVLWIPEMHLRRPAAPLVLTLTFRRRIESPRWKEVVEPHPGWFTHHLELYAVDDVDDEVTGWLREAWEAAG